MPVYVVRNLLAMYVNGNVDMTVQQRQCHKLIAMILWLTSVCRSVCLSAVSSTNSEVSSFMVSEHDDDAALKKFTFNISGTPAVEVSDRMVVNLAFHPTCH